MGILRQLLADPALLPRMSGYMKADRFSDESAALLVSSMMAYYKTYDRVPTTPELLQGLRSDVEKGILTAEKLKEARSYLGEALDRPPIDSKYAIDLVSKEEQATAMFKALDGGLIKYRTKTRESFEAIEKEIIKANLIGRADSSLGTDQFTNLAARTEARKSGKLPPRWGTGVGALDDVLIGGLAAGELGCILATAKGGKSNMMGHIALHIASLGGTVVYVTLEMSEAQIVDRHDAAISMVPINNLRENYVVVDRKVNAWFEKKRGSIVVKYMNPRETTTREIRSYLQQIRAERGIVPTVLIVDYADLMGSASKGFEKRHEELGVIYAELRALLNDLQIPGWTGSQATREALSQQVITAANIAESWQKVAIVDCLVALCRTEEEKAANQMRMFVAACRFASDGIQVGPFETALECGRLVIDGGIG